MIVVDFWGGAGIGKSTQAAILFGRLKAGGFNAELVGEYAKDVILQGDYEALQDPLWLFANQAHRLRGMKKNGVEIAICDSPLPLALTYGIAREKDDNKNFSALVWQEFFNYDNVNFLIERNDSFWKKEGRADDLAFAQYIDQIIHSQLTDHDVDFGKIKPGTEDQEIVWLKTITEYRKRKQG